MIPTPGDLARWAFWVPLRNALNPQRPAWISALSSTWRIRHALARDQRAAMATEFQLCFGTGSEALVSRAYEIGVQNHLEELLLGKLDPESWALHMRFEGWEHLEAARARGKGAIVLFPHAGNFMLMIAGVSFRVPYTQYAARGVPPEELAKSAPDLLRTNALARAARQAREQAEDSLPARFVSLETPVRHLYRCLADNEVVGIALEGRIGRRFEVVEFLGRQALLNPGPYKLAASTGASIVPGLCHVEDDGTNVCTFAPPVYGEDAQGLREACLREAVEPFLRSHPAAYGLWLAHCRLRAGVDDHPLFIDYARDERWRRHVS